MREWRNWQTRTFEVRVVSPYGFKSRLSHQSSEPVRPARSFLFCKIKRSGERTFRSAFRSGALRAFLSVGERVDGLLYLVSHPIL